MSREPEASAYEAAVQSLFARRPEHMAPGLERITALCAALGEPQLTYPSVHITGTNGKTTLARMVAGLLQAHDQTTGTYTSPHLQDVRERLCLNGEPITRGAFVALLDALAGPIAGVERERGEMVSFFETLTALAYELFAGARVDAGVFEVGMGGRWDATNLVRAPVALINTVAQDHPELGATVTDVAREKAGIIKDGAVVVAGEQQPAAAAVIAAEARARAATVLRAGEDFGVEALRAVHDGQMVVLRTPGGVTVDVPLPLHGAHQADNAACALAAVEAFLGVPVDPGRVRAGLGRVRSPGRLQRVVRPGQPDVVLDGAHNPHAARALAAALPRVTGGRRLTLVLGVLGDKDVESLVRELLGVAEDVVVTQPASSRAAPADRLAKAVRLAGRAVHVAEDVPAALAAATGLAGETGVVVVTGSLYTVGEAKTALGA
ncbi:MAG: bifunctional folylpolyglutamate synthase/dihydrofolate synthase [Egibacteraceae bacterium]